MVLLTGSMEHSVPKSDNHDLWSVPPFREQTENVNKAKVKKEICYLVCCAAKNLIYTSQEFCD